MQPSNGRQRFSRIPKRSGFNDHRVPGHFIEINGDGNITVALLIPKKRHVVAQAAQHITEFAHGLAGEIAFRQNHSS